MINLLHQFVSINKFHNDKNFDNIAKYTSLKIYKNKE